MSSTQYKSFFDEMHKIADNAQSFDWDEYKKGGRQFHAQHLQGRGFSPEQAEYAATYLNPHQTADYTPAQAQADMDAEQAEFSGPNKSPAPKKKEHPALTIAKGVGGLGLGAGLGYVGMHGLDKGIQAIRGPGKGIPPAVLNYGAPLIGGAATLGYGLLQNRMLDKAKDYLQPEEQHDGVTEGTSV